MINTITGFSDIFENLKTSRHLKINEFVYSELKNRLINSMKFQGLVSYESVIMISLTRRMKHAN